VCVSHVVLLCRVDVVCHGILQGDEGHCMYIVIEGELAIVAIQDNRTEKELMRRYHGQIVGEFALISDGVRSASVRAGTDCKVPYPHVESLVMGCVDGKVLVCEPTATGNAEEFVRDRP
jgi:CRP-like cAMP-binding protein